MLITLMLAIALITIALLAVLPDLKQQIKRDREDELRHRGTSYMRAIQHFYKKFGRYPYGWKIWRIPTTSAFFANAIKIR